MGNVRLAPPHPPGPLLPALVPPTPPSRSRDRYPSESITTRRPITLSPSAPDIIQDFKVAVIRLLERLARDTLQLARKCES